MGTLEASHTVEVDAPRARCYQIAADIETAPAWQGTLEEVEVLERDDEGRALVSRQSPTRWSRRRGRGCDSHTTRSVG